MTRLLALCLVALATTTAHANTVGAIAVGPVPIGDRSAVANAAEEAAREAGWTLAAGDIPAKDATAVIGCRNEAQPWTCLPSTNPAKDAGRMLLVMIHEQQDEAGSPILVITAKVVAGEQGTAIDQRFCERCTEGALTTVVRELTKEVLKSSAVRSGRTVLSVKSTPAGAQVSLDGKPVGATDGSFNTYPGRHTITIEKAGYEAERREVETAEGATQEVSVTMRPVDEATPAAHGSRMVPAIVMGVGVAAIVAGGVLIAMDEDPSKDGGPTYRDSALPGVVAGVGGVVALGAGFYLWKRASRSTPTVALTNGGAAIGWAGQF
ncbi:MAG: PEGA domain-containing protein [Kofleriaceae bacterium]